MAHEADNRSGRGGAEHGGLRAADFTPSRIEELVRVYRDGLLRDTLPFWIEHGIDREHGGFLTALDRDGTVIDTDKSLWQQERFTWLLATLHATVEPRREWLDLARHGIDFIRRHGFDEDGRARFQVTRDGRPLRTRRYAYSEAFAAMAFAAYARAAGDDEAAEEARDLFRSYLRLTETPGPLAPKVDPSTRPMQGLGPLMIAINTARVLHDGLDDASYVKTIDRSIAAIRAHFVKPELRAVLETTGPDGAVIDHFDGRTLNPGHAIEAAWFILHEARCRGGDRELTDLGTTMLDWMWARGWDEVHGGLLYFTDLRGLPVQEYWHDMKFWWPHCEAIVATLLAALLTGKPTYARWHAAVHDWAHRHFPDPGHGEWFGYLHRDGSVSSRLKGNLWKGPFHVPRMQWYCWTLLDEQGDT